MIILLFTFVSTFMVTSFLYFYRASYDYPDQCATLYNCFVYALDIGFKQDAGISGAVDNP